MVTYTWHVYDIEKDYWEELDRPKDMAQYADESKYELELRREHEEYWVTGEAVVVNGRLPKYFSDEGHKVPQRFHDQVARYL